MTVDNEVRPGLTLAAMLAAIIVTADAASSLDGDVVFARIHFAFGCVLAFGCFSYWLFEFEDA